MLRTVVTSYENAVKLVQSLSETVQQPSERVALNSLIGLGS